MSRRQFIKLRGGGIAGVSLLSACGGFGGGGDSGGGGGGETVFSFGPDDSGTRTKVLDRYNKQADTKASYQLMPADTGQYFDKIRTQFQAGGGDIDVIGGDVIWPGQFAANGWIADLSDQVPDSERSKFLDGPIQSNTYEGKRYGVPWFTDAGMLYYRVDLLDKAGFSEPPTTYDELIEMATKIQQDEGIKFGYVFQGANYEGGVVDGLEFISNAGGDVLDPNDATKVVIDSPEAAAGLAAERRFVERE
ncbi:MAG TPA: extracellular solute-binding protein [Actinomycetota bacterium]|nr:extracellular solute-binding protein [Actinomycetota bacterium]